MGEIIDELHDIDLNTDGVEKNQTLQEELLRKILIELKHLNLHMSFITDVTTLQDEDELDN